MPPYDDISKEHADMRQRTRRWLEGLSDTRMPRCFAGDVCWVPAADIYETEAAYHLVVDLAGIDPATIVLEIEGEMLRLSGERLRPQVSACNRIHQREIDFGAFQRLFQFPIAMDSERAESSYLQGFLKIILPKRQKPTAVQVTVKEG